MATKIKMVPQYSPVGTTMVPAPKRVRGKAGVEIKPEPVIHAEQPKAKKGKEKPQQQKAPKGSTKAEQKAEGIITLTAEQKTAEATFISTAVGVEQSRERVAECIADCYALAIHRAYGMTLTAWVEKTLTGAGIAKATVYYLRDIGVGFATLGTERARLFPREGLRQIVAVSKGDPKRIEAMATTAQCGTEDAKPTLKQCKAAANAGKPERADAEIVAGLARMARNHGKTYEAAVALLEKAVARLLNQQAKEQAEADAEEGSED